ncbi:MAG TPA: hypothetical protein DEQ43_07385 [Nocardioides bacterium]|nr:hypothetical protein [Nocardioides sp.]
MAEHQWEADHGYPIDHFIHIATPDRTPGVGVEMRINEDGSTQTVIGVEDDYYDIDMAERTALAMLEAVKVARA